ncbi:glucosaminidase domain-containing protein [Alteromonas sp. 5E99-2]|uniref:glucosaminidase domain-containing protein n=1 Tax=Alteromonas sp. 5E99-2 TaxID=2817683 RepID=UPI001A995220|nr:glucosaminidase domain-containing protein [Alteromonas sp. 5E99-2]MBO1255059.1 glucosaminidase domain-containing protein [Alteromonas sp. 5E99-2]
MIRKSSLLRIALSFTVAIALVAYLWSVSTTPVEKNLVPSISKSADKPVPDFSQYTQTKKKKTAFFDYLKPEIQQQNDHILGIRHQLLLMKRKADNGEVLAFRESEKLNWLAKEYRVESDEIAIGGKGEDSQSSLINALLVRVDIIPLDLVLVQAANESAWGTSRFAREGYNFFGLWCFTEGCGFVPNSRNAGAIHEVEKFDNLTDAVYTYLRNLNRHDAYQELRKVRAQLRANQQPISGNALAEGLVNYSERGHEYVEEIQAMIRINKKYF